ncbi:MAG: hypothetical protein JHD35_11295 [Sphingopyxis sp.]|nr:hypothetical protein [Sphingopyxis sp.]
MTMFVATRPNREGFGSLFWTLGMSIGAAAVLLFLLFSPRPFIATIATILWLVALMGTAAFVQFGLVDRARTRAERAAWRAAAAPYLVGAAILIADPLLGNGRLASALAAGLGISGLARLSVALGSDRAGRRWIYVSGSITIAVAMLIAFGWPFSLVTPIIKALALDLLVLGVMLILSQAGGKYDGMARQR